MFSEHARTSLGISPLTRGFLRHASSFSKSPVRYYHLTGPRGARGSCLAVIILKEMHCICKCPVLERELAAAQVKEKKAPQH